MATLTSADMAQLDKYASSGDRYNYWKFLSNKGDKYATLALSVVTNESLLGQSANGHFAAYYLNKTGKTQTSQEVWETGVKIMQADLAMRKNYLQSPTTKNPLDLTIEDIRNYHKAVFVDQMKLDATAWTFEDIYQDLLRDKGKVAAETFWDEVLDSYTIIAAFRTLVEYGENLDTPIGKEWAKTQFLVFAKQAKVISNRSIDKLDYNGKTYTYDYKNKKWYYEVGGFKTFIKEEAPGSLQTILNNERNFRIQKFGNNVINTNTSNLFHFMPSEADWNKFLAESVTVFADGSGHQLIGKINGSNATITIYKDGSSAQKYTDINGNEIEVKLDVNQNLTSFRTLEKTTNLTTEITRTYKTITATNETVATDINRVRDSNNNIVWGNSSIIISSDKGVIELMPQKNAVTGKYELVAASKTLEGESTLLSPAELNNLLTKMGVNPSLLNSSTGDLTALYSAVNSATNTTKVIQTAIDHQEAWQLKADYIFNGAQKIFNDIFNVETLNGAVQAWFSENFNNLVNGSKSESELLYSFVKKYFETYAKDKISDSFQSFIANNTSNLSQSEAVIALQKISDKVFGTNASHLTQGVGQVLVSSLSRFIASAVIDGKGYNSSQYATLAASTLVSSAATYTIVANSVPGLTMVNSAGSITLSPAGQGAVAAIVTTAASLINDHKLNSSEYSMLGVQAAIAAISAYIGAAASVVLTPIGGAIVAAAVNFVLSKVVSSIYKGKVYYENEYGTVEEAWASRFLITGEMTKTSEGKDYYKKTMHLVDHFTTGSNSGGTAPSNRLSYTERFNVDDILGTKSVDVAIGNIKDNVIVTHEGDDFVMAEGGDDQIALGEGADFAYGGAGNDTILGQFGNDLIFGDSGNDTLVGGEGDDELDGGAGDDVLLGDRELNSGETTVVGYGNDVLRGGKGSDTLLGGEGNDLLSGDEGSDRLVGGLGDDMLFGGLDNDVLEGEEGDDYLTGGLGNDNLDGGAGSDLLYGDAGDDILIGGDGADYLSGGDGKNYLQGDSGNDFLIGGSDQDILVGGDGDDIIQDGLGADIIDTGRGNDIVQITKGSTGDDIDTGLGDDIILSEQIENITIRDISGTDKILLSQVLAANIVFSADGVDLLISDKTTGKKIRIENQLLEAGPVIEYLEFKGGQYYDLKKINFNSIVPPNLLTHTDQISETLVKIQDSLNAFNPRFEAIKNRSSVFQWWEENKKTASQDILYDSSNILINDINTNIIKRKRSVFGGYYTVVQVEKNIQLKTDIVNVQVVAEDGTKQIISENINQIVGAEWDEVIDARNSKDVTYLYGNGGNDEIYAGAYQDIIYGGDGNDKIQAYGVGDYGLITDGSLRSIYTKDYYRGGSGNDKIIGNVSYNSYDLIYGDDGDDELYGAGHSYLNGGDGNDVFYFNGNAIDQNYVSLYKTNEKDYRVLEGGMGDDRYLFKAKDNMSLYASIIEYDNQGTDTIQLLDDVKYFDMNYYANVENLVFYNWNINFGFGSAPNNTNAGIYNFIGNNKDNFFDISNENNTIIDGQGGSDTVRFTFSRKQPATINLSIQTEQNYAGVKLTLKNIENLSGSTFDDIFIGNSQDNRLIGDAGNDTLKGDAGNDILDGGTGNDTYIFSRGSNLDTIIENDTTAGNKDTLSFDSNIAANQLWFTKTGNNLEVSVIGTTDKAVIKDWYLGNAYHVEELKSGNGLTLLDSQVQNLVNAMASLTPPAVGQTSLSADYQTKLNPVITANWK